MNVTPQDPHKDARIRRKGAPIDEARAAVVLLHGRGGTAENILDLADAFGLENVAYLAPQATGNTWYPYSFLTPVEANEPSLSSALRAVGDIVADLEASGVPKERIVLGGFSQGACLASEFVAQNAARYGGLFVLSGGLIGPDGTPRDYQGSLDGTPVFVGCSDQDAHIPLSRVHETTAVLQALGGDVTERIYPGMGHTVNSDEIARVAAIIKKAAGRAE